MKHRDLVSRLQDAGCVLLRHGGKHDIYHNPKTGRSEPVPRHREVNELLAKKILRSLIDSEYEKKG
jgi:mRNA interferase HicA